MSSNRRDFLKKATLVGAGLTLSGNVLHACAKAEDKVRKGKYMGGFAAPKLNTIRIAVIGVGERGPDHARHLATIEGTEIVAISDLYEDFATKVAGECTAIGKGQRHKNVKAYFGGQDEWKKMLAEVKPDMVVIATPWELHAPMAIASMEAGAHAFVEVPIATTIQDMWNIVDTSEKTQKHCMMMENVNYGREELLYLNMCRQNVLGELLHGEASYIHDLRFQMFSVDRGCGSWRTYEYAKRNGNLYPTHGLGPVSQYMNIDRTDDLFKHIVSYSSPSRARQIFAKENFPPDHKWNALKFIAGDINTSIIKTEVGRTILVQWDENSPRPYTRKNLIQGTKGTLAGFPTRMALEGGVLGITKDHHEWAEGEQLEAVFEKYEHPLYKRLGELSKKMGGHGGMDFMMLYRMVECLRNGLPLDQNVYEGCSWSAVGPLSAASITADGMPQQFPDFTRGDWKTTAPLNIIS